MIACCAIVFRRYLASRSGFLSPNGAYRDFVRRSNPNYLNHRDLVDWGILVTGFRTFLVDTQFDEARLSMTETVPLASPCAICQLAIKAELLETARPRAPANLEIRINTIAPGSGRGKMAHPVHANVEHGFEHALPHLPRWNQYPLRKRHSQQRASHFRHPNRELDQDHQ